MDDLVTLESSVEHLRRAVRDVSLTATPADPFYPLVRLHLSSDGLVATAPTEWDGPSFHVRYDPAVFDGIDPAEPCVVPLGTEATLRWLDWFDDATITATVRGADGVAEDVVLESEDYSVAVGPLPTEVVDPDAAVTPPGEFVDGQLVHEGEPAPTRVRTTGETLQRLATAVDIVDDESVPVVVEDGHLRLSVSGDVMHGRGRLPGTVEGPDCSNRYGEGFAAVARVLSGPLELQIVPGGPMAVVQETDDATRRYVLTQSM